VPFFSLHPKRLIKSAGALGVQNELVTIYEVKLADVIVAASTVVV
jgi:hypothetical protein